MKAFAADAVPEGTITPRLTPELRAQVEQTVQALRAAGFDVVVALDGPSGEQVPTWVCGNGVRLLERLRCTASMMVSELEGRPAPDGARA